MLMMLSRLELNEIYKLKTHLNQTFSIKELRLLHYVLGIDFSYFPSRDVVHTLEKFTKELLLLLHWRSILQKGYDSFTDEHEAFIKTWCSSF